MSNIEVNGNNNFVSMQEDLNEDILDLEIGILDDMDVEMDDPLSKLLDSAEELTFTKDNSKQTRLSDRKQKDNQTRIEQKIEKFKKLMSVKVGKLNNDRDALMNLAKKWKEPECAVEEVLHSLKELGTHSASAYVFLDDLIKDPEYSDIKDKLVDAQTKLFETDKSLIVAAFNALEVAEQNQQLGDSATLCQSYADITNNFTEPKDMLQYILGKYNTDSEACIDFMTKALVADLASIETSQNKITLEIVGTNLSKVKELNSARVILEDGFNNMEKLVDNSSKNLQNVNSLNVLGNVLSLSNNRFVTANQVRDIYSFIDKQNPEKEVLLAQVMLKTVRSFSPDVFTSEKERMSIVEGTQKLVDDCITKEDEWLEAGGN